MLSCIKFISDSSTTPQEDDPLLSKMLSRKFPTFMNQLESDVLFEVCSYLSIRDKLLSIRFVNKIWFHYCWISVQTFSLDENVSAEMITFLLQKVLLQNQCHQFVECLEISNTSHFKPSIHLPILLQECTHNLNTPVFVKLQKFKYQKILQNGVLPLLLQQMPNLREVYCCFHNSTIEDLEPLRQLKKLEQITLMDACLPNECYQLLSQLFLKKLVFVDSTVQHALPQLASSSNENNTKDSVLCDSLQELELMHCLGMVEESLLLSLAQFRNLKHITIWNSKLTVQGPVNDHSFQLLYQNHCHWVTQLEKLALLGKSIDCEKSTDSLFETIGKCKQLKELEINFWTFREQVRNGSTSSLLLTEKGIHALNQCSQLEIFRIYELDLLKSEGHWALLFCKFTHLQILMIQGCTITNEALSAIFATNPMLCETLKELSLEYCSQVTSMKWIQVYKSDGQEVVWKNLKKLELSRFIHLKDGIECISNTRLPKLKHLAITRCNKVDNQIFIYLSQIQDTVEQLNLSGSSIADDQLAFLQNMKQLKQLNISHCGNISGVGFSYLPFKYQQQQDLLLAPNFNLTELKLEMCHSFTDDGLLYISCINSLRYLYLMQCVKVTEKGYAYIAKLERLEKLYLRGCSNISDSCVLQITNQCTELRELTVSCNYKLTDACLKNFFKLKQLEMLTMNYWSNQYLTDKGIQMCLSVLKDTLNVLDVKRCHKITPKIQKYLPNTLILFDSSQLAKQSSNSNWGRRGGVG